jgi:hypothetical protein
MLLGLAAVLAAVAAINWTVNPYGAWRPAVVDPAHRVTGTARGEAGERVTVAYRLRAARPTTLLVGSSRVIVGMHFENHRQTEIFNASLSGASLAEIAAILRLAATNPRLERVIWGVDFYPFDRRFDGFRHPETRRRLEGSERQVLTLRITETLLSLRALDDSRRVLMSAVRRRPREAQTIPVPWPADVIRARLADPAPGLAAADHALLKAQLADWVGNYSGYRASGALTALFRRAVADVRAAGVDLVLFVPPLSRCELEAIDQTGSWSAFQQWRRDLLATGPYWDFSGYGKLDRRESFFLDVAHFWPAVGHVMMRQFLGRDCGQCGEWAPRIRDAGVRVDGTTVDAYLARQDALRAAARREGHRCEPVVAEMLR